MQLLSLNRRSAATRVLGLAVLGLLAALPAAADDTASKYALGVSDKISVRVVEWQSAGATFQDWTAVTGSYLVGPEGAVSFPFVGEVQAAGKTTAELSQALSAGLRSTLGLTDPPNVTVEVETFGPVYVTGDVQSSGAYPYAPGLNVIKAISLAGGLRHGAADASPDANRQLIDLQGTYNVLKDQRLRLLIQRARLDAVLGKQDSLTMPAQVKDDAQAPALAETETAILKAGQDQIKSQTVALDAQKQLLGQSIDALAQKRDTATQQLTLAQDRLQKVQTLATNGLAITDRVMTLQSNVADLEGQLLDIDTADLKAKQDVTVADTQSAKLVSDALLQASQDRQDVDAQLAQTELKLTTQQKLIQEAIASGGAPTEAASVTYTYTILRDGEEIPASKVDALRPGDVVTVAVAITP
jgi:exopolysaccharide production protein ExoF